MKKLSAAILLLLFAICWIGPWLMPAENGGLALLNRLKPPSMVHLLGTDELGRDALRRLLLGGRVSLLVGLGAAVIAGLIGTAAGLLATRRGRLDGAIFRLADLLLALPILPLAIVLTAIDPARLHLPSFGPQGRVAAIIALAALFTWPSIARMVRAEALSQAARGYAKAARALGATPLRVVWYHLWPAVRPVALTATALGAGSAILFESVLSFLGFGLPPTIPSWGGLLTRAADLVHAHPLLALTPGLLIFLTVAAINGLVHARRSAQG